MIEVEARAGTEVGARARAEAEARARAEAEAGEGAEAEAGTEAGEGTEAQAAEAEAGAVVDLVATSGEVDVARPAPAAAPSQQTQPPAAAEPPADAIPAAEAKATLRRRGRRLRFGSVHLRYFEYACGGSVPSGGVSIGLGEPAEAGFDEGWTYEGSGGEGGDCFEEGDEGGEEDEGAGTDADEEAVERQGPAALRHLTEAVRAAVETVELSSYERGRFAEGRLDAYDFAECGYMDDGFREDLLREAGA